MKDIAVGVAVALVVLVTFWAVLWMLGRSSETNERQCRSEAEKHGDRATCVVVTR
ncbi:hypothetical protein GCM10009601_20100 [Streptomyces thermospinosisporus]|uniref:Uncharacterized protein n=1 Tax=Streptomyces thermospinosisporus TaxID=161482 RepID=A0ABP4JIB2_9ACTN